MGPNDDLPTVRAILVTGAASGIGAATARRFADRGWLVGIFDIDETGAAALASEIGAGRAVAGRLDVRDPASWAAAVAAFAEASGGRLDVLVNNAGVLATGPLDGTPDKRLQAVVDVNVMGVVRGVRACLPLLEATGNARIVNISSIAGLQALPEAAVYSASKFAVRGLGQALRGELAPRGVALSTIYPGFVDTPMLAEERDENAVKLTDRLKDLGFKFYGPDTIAKAVWKAVERGRDEAGGGGQGRVGRLFADHLPAVLRLVSHLTLRQWRKTKG